jgi:zinc transporter 1/2/3
MIMLQAIFNPVGILLGWLLEMQGPLTVGIATAISAGTFIYIATIEVISH